MRPRAFSRRPEAGTSVPTLRRVAGTDRFVAMTPVSAPLVAGTFADLVRSKQALVAGNAFLRHQLAIRYCQAN